MRVRSLLVVALGSIGLAGCFPATLVFVPALHGRVIDAQSRPVPNATVELVPDRPGTDSVLIQAAADGTFHREESRRDFVYLPGMHVVTPPSYTVMIHANGQRVPTTQVTGGVRSFGQGVAAGVQDLGDLRLP